LKDSLGGNSETLIITCIQDVAADYSETLPALTFAANAKTIINDIRVNITEERRLSMSNETGELRKKLRDLESQCRSLQDLLKSKDQELNALKSRNSTITDILVQPLSNEGKLNAIASSMDVVIPETVAERTQDITQKSLIPLTELFELKATVKKQNAIINSLRDLIDKDSEMPIIPRLFKFKPLGNQ
jgi:chromosome segregation ATPase